MIYHGGPCPGKLHYELFRNLCNWELSRQMSGKSPRPKTVLHVATFSGQTRSRSTAGLILRKEPFSSNAYGHIWYPIFNQLLRQIARRIKMSKAKCITVWKLNLRPLKSNLITTNTFSGSVCSLTSSCLCLFDHPYFSNKMQRPTFSKTTLLIRSSIHTYLLIKMQHPTVSNTSLFIRRDVLFEQNATPHIFEHLGVYSKRCTFRTKCNAPHFITPRCLFYEMYFSNKMQRPTFSNTTHAVALSIRVMLITPVMNEPRILQKWVLRNFQFFNFNQTSSPRKKGGK
jgi:hypothetical protein